MPTASVGPWLEQALAKGLVRDSRPAPVRAPALPPKPSEKRFQAEVVALAVRAGWEPYHAHDSRRSNAGWPDLALVRGPVLILAELKTDGGRLSAAQSRWLELLRAVPGVRVRLWRPALWAAIVSELTAGGAA